MTKLFLIMGGVVIAATGLTLFIVKQLSDSLIKGAKDFTSSLPGGTLNPPSVKTIIITRDFSKFPGGRYKADGEFSAEHFREDLLIPALKEYDHVDIIMDGALGYASNWLEEVFGGLVRSYDKSEDISNRLTIISNDRPWYAGDAERFMKTAQDNKSKEQM